MRSTLVLDPCRLPCICRVTSWVRRARLPSRLSISPVESAVRRARARTRSAEHTSELQSLMRISYALFCLKKKKALYRTKTKHPPYKHQCTALVNIAHHAQDHKYEINSLQQ